MASRSGSPPFTLPSSPGFGCLWTFHRDESCAPQTHQVLSYSSIPGKGHPSPCPSYERQQQQPPPWCPELKHLMYPRCFFVPRHMVYKWLFPLQGQGLIRSSSREEGLSFVLAHHSELAVHVAGKAGSRKLSAHIFLVCQAERGDVHRSPYSPHPLLLNP